MWIPLMFIVEVLSFQDIVTAIVVIAVGVVTYKSGVFQAITSSSKDLLELRTRERDDAKREVKELKDENRMLRRENIQRGEINAQDQKTILKLKGQLGTKINEEDIDC